VFLIYFQVRTKSRVKTVISKLSIMAVSKHKIVFFRFFKNSPLSLNAMYRTRCISENIYNTFSILTVSVTGFELIPEIIFTSYVSYLYNSYVFNTLNNFSHYAIDEFIYIYIYINMDKYTHIYIFIYMYII